MGCLNSNKNFSHRFANIHLSGPCNRKCYFCIGQHMMALDSFNNLNKWPLKYIGAFLYLCLSENINLINLTGTNTDPMLYKRHEHLVGMIRKILPDSRIGIRTNGVEILNKLDDWLLYDHGSISFPSFNPEIYEKIMGGSPPDMVAIFKATPSSMDLKVNIVLCPEITTTDLLSTIWKLGEIGYKKINLREPYGQPHLGDPIGKLPGAYPMPDKYGMPVYLIMGVEVTYWDVHYVEVESLNLYASGKISADYPITRGHDEMGLVQDQSQFTKSGRVREQWVKK